MEEEVDIGRTCLGRNRGGVGQVGEQYRLRKHILAMVEPFNKAFVSPSFAFLVEHDEVLVRHAALAERYLFDDPNSALLKLRQFGELLAQHAAAYAGITVEERASQHELLDRLRDRQLINAQVAQLFHGLRKAGNEAAHQHLGERREALHQLQMARQLAVWFHKSFGGDSSFRAGPFIPPPDPRQAERELHTELERLRATLVSTQEDRAGSQQLLAEHTRQRQEAEAAEYWRCDVSRERQSRTPVKTAAPAPCRPARG